MPTLDRIKAYPENEYPTVTKVAGTEVEPGNVVQAGTNAGEVDVANDETSPIGVAARQTIGDDNETHKSGNSLPVIVSGVCRLVSSEAISEGDQVATDASGRVKTHETGTDPENIIVGRALTETSGSDEALEVMVNL